MSAAQKFLSKASTWTSSSPFSIAKQHNLAYLGLKIVKKPSSLYHLNYHTMIAKIIGEMEAWMHLTLSLFRRCHLFQMDCFAPLLYSSHTIPFLIQQNYMHRIHKAMLSLVWLNKKTLYSFIYTLSPEEGRTNLLNIREYILACLHRNGLD